MIAALVGSAMMIDHMVTDEQAAVGRVTATAIRGLLPLVRSADAAMLEYLLLMALDEADRMAGRSAPAKHPQ
jgi:hypothetical protein